MRTLSIIIAVLASAAAACSPYAPELGAAPFFCGSAEPKCPDGYMCMPQSGGGSDVCVAPNGKVPDGGANANCTVDQQLEPNDSIATAWQTPVDTQKKSFPLAGLAICPAGDKDNYSVTITPNGTETLEAIIEFDPSMGATLSGSILNSTGVPIANASPVSGATGKLRAAAATLPPGIYYVQVYGPATGAAQTTNTYKLTINVTP